MITEEKRSYEVSLWTLQDEFITVLKWSNVEQQGRIQEPQMTLNVDGTQNFNFSIPMYLYYYVETPQPHMEKKENPIWYNTRNGNLIASMRKIKVIFNKGEAAEAVIEFIITKVTEEHQKDQLICKIECEGLAFNELGKIGYKYTLNMDEVELDQAKLQKTQGIDAEIHTTVDYWAQKIGLVPYPQNNIDPNIWYYQVQMNWDSFGANGVTRDSSKVYEEEYTSSWQVNSNTIMPKTVENCREKERIIDTRESNIYNITQTIAETFEIFCRYEYEYDENYHIVSKKVIFYNNFISEDEGFSSITYPYDAQSISRNMDSTNLTTKLYVQSSDTDDTVLGSNSISLSNANKTKEDYLLDFDYLYTINGINDEQYAAIKTYEAAILNHNNTIIPIQEKCNAIQKLLIDLKAEQKIAEESVELDNKQTELYKQKLEAYDKLDSMVDGKISITQTAPKLKVLITEDAEKKTYSINLGDQDKGIDAGSVQVFRTWNSATGKCFGRFVDYTPKFDTKDNILIGLEHLRYAPTSFNASDVDGSGKAYILSTDPTTPPNSGWTEVDSFPDASTFDDKKSETPFYWKNEYTVYKNGYIHNVYTMECLSYTAALDLNVKRYVIKKEPIYYYKDAETPPSIPTSEVTTTETTKDTWTKGLRNYESGVKCYITYQYQYRTFVTTEILDGDQGISAASTIPSSNIVLEWSPSTPIIDSKYNSQPSSSYVYVTYDYFPKLYYDELIKYWSDKSQADDAKSKNLLDIIGSDESNPKTGLYLDYDTQSTALDNALAAKRETIKKFEQMMGPALREGYWTPEDYQDYGDSYSKSGAFGNNYTADAAPAADATDAIISWDGLLFDDEEDYYYEMETIRKHVAYPCINLTEVYGSTSAALTAIKALLDKKGKNEGTPGFIYSDSNCRNLSGVTTSINNADMPNTITDNVRDPKYVRLFALDSEAIPAFGVVNNTVVPILILTGAKQLESSAIDKMKRTIAEDNDSKGGNPVIGLFNYTQNDDGEITITISGDPHVVSHTNAVWITPTKVVYPRIRIRSDAIQTTENNLFVSYGNNNILKNNEDYKVAFRTNTVNNNYYTETCITLKNHVIFGNGNLSNTATVKYTLSNANTIIYLDAIKVLKENSIPKASYEVSVNVLNEALIHNLYERLTQILMINDAELKFQDVFGYISQIELNLDAPQEDKIEVKNYKTKFEDLFSTIVAQTEEMKKNGNAFFAAASGDITLSPAAVEETIYKNKDIWDAYRDSGFDGSEVVQAKLESIAQEIGLILGAANQSLDRLYGLTLENANILSGFVENIAQDLTPHVYYGTTPPDKARTGDIFYQTDPETGEVVGQWLGNTNGGFTKTFDGKLSEITGAAMNIDAKKGVIEILSGSRIDMKTGGDLYIAANENINIVGNKSVNIGGGAISIAALASDNKGISIVAVEEGAALIAAKVYELLLSQIKKTTNYVESDFTNSSGQNKAFATALNAIKSTNGNNYRFNFGDGIIYEVAKTSLENSGTFSYVKAYKWLSQKVTTTSLIDIKPKQIMMKSSNLIMKASSKILLVTSDGTMDGTSALQLSPDEGIFLGSGKGITLFAGATNNNNNTLINYDEATQKISLSSGSVLGSTFQLKPEYLIFGVAQLSTGNNTEEGAVMELTKDHMVFGTSAGPLKVHTTTTSEHTVGEIESQPNINISYKTSMTGVEITKDKFGLATLGSFDNTYNISNLLLMNNEGLLLGTVLVKKSDGTVYSPQTKNEISPSNNDTIDSNIYTQGSYVVITPSLVEIGSLSNLYINTNNFKLQTDSYKVENGKIVGKTTLDNTIMAIGSGLQSINKDTVYDAANNQFKNGNTVITGNPDVRLLINKNGAYIKGSVYASAFVASCNKGYFKATGDNLGFYHTNGNAVMTLSGNAMTVAGSFDITADNILIDSDATGTNPVFKLRKKTNNNSYTDYLTYLADGTLSLTVSSLNIGATSLSAYVSNAVSNASSEFTMSPYDIWMGVKSQANGTNTALQLTDSSIVMKASEGSSTTNFTLDTNGIEMNGNNITINSGHLLINGKQEWSREDIIFSFTKPPASGTGAHPSDRPWIWIKPQGVASLFYGNFSYSAPSGIGSKMATGITDSVNYFVDGNEYYRYKVSVTLHMNYASSSEVYHRWVAIWVASDTNGSRATYVGCKYCSFDWVQVGESTKDSLTVMVNSTTNVCLTGNIYVFIKLFPPTNGLDESDIQALPYNYNGGGGWTILSPDDATIDSCSFEATTPANNATSTGVPCDVYYFDPTNG